MIANIDMWLAEAKQLHKVDEHFKLFDEEIHAKQTAHGRWRAYWISTAQNYGGAWGGPDSHLRTTRYVFRDSEGIIIEADTFDALEIRVIELMHDDDYLPAMAVA